MFTTRKTNIYREASSEYLYCLWNIFPAIYCWSRFYARRSYAVKLTKTAYPDKYKYSVCGIGFDVSGTLSMSDGHGLGKQVIILVADMSSSIHIDNKKKDILINSKDPTQELDDTKLTEEEQ